MGCGRLHQHRCRTGQPDGRAEDAANDTTVGFGRGFDDDGDALTYTITAGNVGNAFKIDAATGHIQVNDADAIDFETLVAIP